MKNKFIFGDCMNAENGLPSYSDNYFQLAIVDVPYGINEDGGKSASRCRKTGVKPNNFVKKGWDKEAPSQEYFNELFRVSKNQIIWGANHFISKLPYDSSCWIVWDKDNGNNDFADCELAWCSFKTAVRKAKFKWHGMLQQDMKNKEIRIHPTQKPVKLYQWLLENYTKSGGVLLDTHVGSASSLIAFESMGFNYVGYEVDEDYYKAAKNRISKGIQKILF